MYKYLITFCLLLVFLIDVKAQTDSLKNEKLPEIVVTAEGQIEMSNKTLLIPTQLEKNILLTVLIYCILCRLQTWKYRHVLVVLLLIVEERSFCALMVWRHYSEDVASLSAKNIRTIEYIRTPSGKYAGKAGLVNFVTIKMNYGGNVYLSANEGFAYKSGEYLAFADFNKKRYSLSLTAIGDWHRDHSYTGGNDMFTFSDKSVLERN